MHQVDLARGCGWGDASAVSRIETDRILPRRRTILKLAAQLADPAVTGTAGEIAASLFLAAGVLPTAHEVQDLRRHIPDIDRLPHPAKVMDFGWNLWRANEWFARGVGLPRRYAGRNYLELFFENGGSIRRQLGEAWYGLAPTVVAEFRRETARQKTQLWFKKLLLRLRALPHFEDLWKSETKDGEDVFGWSCASVGSGIVSTVRAPLNSDPRLIVRLIFPHDPDSATEMIKLGALARYDTG
jgi:hypothetical protein